MAIVNENNGTKQINAFVLLLLLNWEKEGGGVLWSVVFGE